MVISISKTEAIWFFPKGDYVPLLNIDGEPIKFVSVVKYLGLLLDCKLTYKNHIVELIKRMEPRINVLKMVAGNKWGGHPQTLLNVFKATVRSLVDYGCSIYGNASLALLNKISTAYNRGLRICLRAFKTMPIHALHVEAGVMPLKFRREEFIVKEVIKSTAFQFPIIHLVEKAKQHNRQRRKPKHSKYIQRAMELTEWTKTIELPKDPIPKPPNLETHQILGETTLTKDMLSENQWKHLAETTISENYLGYHKIYTDASKGENAIGIGVTDLDELQLSKSLNPEIQITNGELIAILQAILLNTNVNRNVVILTDSRESCRVLDSGDKYNYLITKIWKEIAKRKQFSYIIQWIPGHCGIEGNEAADLLAKLGTNEEQLSYHITLNDAILYAKDRSLKSWQSDYAEISLTKGQFHWIVTNKISTKPWFAKLPLNGTNIRIGTRLRTGHGFCGVRQHMFGLTTSNRCEQCNVTNDLEHIMLFCTKYHLERQQFNVFQEVNSLMELMATADWSTYLQIGQFYKLAKLSF